MRLHKNPTEYFDDGEFYDRFRFSKAVFLEIVELIRHQLERPTRRSQSVTPEQQLALALRFFATGDLLNDVGDSLQFHKSTVSRAVHAVAAALAECLDDFVRMPRPGAESDNAKEAFVQLAEFPGIIGAIDGTHVRIIRPSQHEPDFINRKGVPSINVQAVCNAKGKFLNLVADWPGSAHDSRILNESQLAQDFEAGNYDGLLLGDSGYGCKMWLLTPLLAPNNAAEGRYNRKHKQTRVIIEQAFGRWKRPFTAYMSKFA